MISSCAVCGKKFYVEDPAVWVYRSMNKFFCTYPCTREYDMKEEPMKKVTLEQKKKAVQIAIGGEDPRRFLKECGSKNPDLMWGSIRKNLKEKDPEMFAKLPGRIPRKKDDKEPEVSLADAMTGMQEAADKFFGACEDMGLKMETPENPLPVQDLKLQPGGNYRISVETPEAPKIYKPVVYDGMTVREVEGGFGRYRRSDTKDSIYIDFEYAEGVDVVSLTVDQWRSFRDEQLKAAMILGVAL